jgi:pimeloyl-ACP methyl ester carboxylesterase
VKSVFLEAGSLRLHYLDHGASDATTLVMLHGITSNAHAFDAIAAAGLAARRRLVSLDLRGRGLSDRPPTGYGMADHAGDVLALLDALGLGRATIVGHSFGALLGYYLAARHPERVERLVAIDAAMQFHPRLPELLAPSLGRLGKVFPSFEAYLAAIRATPQWNGVDFDDAIVAHYRADVETLEGGAVRPRSPAEVIAEAGRRLGEEPWRDIVPRVLQPVLLLNALGPYGLPGTPPLLPRELAMETVRALPQGQYAEVPGNHMTMVFGDGARVAAELIARFVGAAG